MALLEVHDLTVTIGKLQPLDGISFSVDKREILGLVGESGSGKSLTALAVAGLLPLMGGMITSGSVQFDGKELTTLAERDYQKLRGRRIAFITQNPMTALDPVQRIGDQIDIVSQMHIGLSAAAARQRSIELLTKLRIAEASAVCRQYAHQLSGGMKQRIVIAMALAGKPDLIIADEPTTALDVTVQAQIILLLARLVKEEGLALLLITHDMGVVAQCCDKVAVLYAGRLAESRDVNALFKQPRHPYTRALIDCIPRSDTLRRGLTGIPGSVPTVSEYPVGCRYHPRCPSRQSICERGTPPAVLLEGGLAFCHFAGEAEAAR